VDGNVTLEEESDEVEEEEETKEDEEEKMEDEEEGEEEKNDKPTQGKKKRAEKIDWRNVTLDLTIGDDAMMYKAAVQYMYSWLESRLINATKGNKSASKRIHVIALDSEGEEVSTDEDDDEEHVSVICNIVCLELSLFFI
jgi:hypothetical protein